MKKLLLALAALCSSTAANAHFDWRFLSTAPDFRIYLDVAHISRRAGGEAGFYLRMVLPSPDRGFDMHDVEYIARCGDHQLRAVSSTSYRTNATQGETRALSGNFEAAPSRSFLFAAVEIACGRRAVIPNSVSDTRADARRRLQVMGNLAGWWVRLRQTESTDCGDAWQFNSDGTFSTSNGNPGFWEFDGSSFTMTRDGQSLTFPATVQGDRLTFQTASGTITWGKCRG
jgi:hypothetical protein